MRKLKGYIRNATSGLPVPAAIVRSGLNPNLQTTTSEGGYFELNVEENDTYIEVYAIGTGTNGYTQLYIPASFPYVFWEIELINDPFETSTMEFIDKRNKKKMWPVYAGLGLFLLLLLTRKKKRA